jgi:putative ABC transport system permease protein
MFFIRYLLRELRRRMRQAIVIGLGLALGVGLVITVTAASSGVQDAQAAVLHSLYGIGTDITVTKQPHRASDQRMQAAPPKGGGNGRTMCINGSCSAGSGGKIDALSPQAYGTMADSEVASVAKLAGVKTAVGGLLLNDTQVTLPKQGSNTTPQPNTFSVDGVDLAHRDLGPYSSGTVSSGRNFTTADADSNVAVVDSNYARSNGIAKGDTIKVGGKSFTVIGLVSQPQGSNPPNVYIPLARAQAIASGIGSDSSLKNKINTIYVQATSNTGISAVQKEISKLMPSATVTTSSDLADQVTGSLSSTAKLANVLGRWLSVLVLIAAFAVAALLTMAAVARRAREFGTLKALGWRTRRIIAQVMGESISIGLLGGAAGVGLGFAGAAIITAIAPKLSATLASDAGAKLTQIGPGGQSADGPQNSPTAVSVPLSASVSHDAIVLAVVLAIVGGLVAGAFASWRIARLRPVDALARVA